MDKNEIKMAIEGQIKSYEKMIEDNQDIMIELQQRIEGYKDINKGYLDKMKGLSDKLKKLSEADR